MNGRDLVFFTLSALLQKCHVGSIDCIVIFVSFFSLYLLLVTHYYIYLRILWTIFSHIF